MRVPPGVLDPGGTPEGACGTHMPVRARMRTVFGTRDSCTTPDVAVPPFAAAADPRDNCLEADVNGIIVLEAWRARQVALPAPKRQRQQWGAARVMGRMVGPMEVCEDQPDAHVRRSTSRLRHRWTRIAEFA
jgi:hypothetical protein